MSALLADAILKSVAKHGSYRAAGKVLGVDHAYLHKLATGEKDAPSEALLKKLGLRRTVTITYTARKA